jgi:hypothetical protein
MAQFNTITTGHIMLYPCEHVPKTSVIERIVSGDFWFLYWEGLERGMLGLQSIKSFPDTDYRLGF